MDTNGPNSLEGEDLTNKVLNFLLGVPNTSKFPLFADTVTTDNRRNQHCAYHKTADTPLSILLWQKQ